MGLLASFLSAFFSATKDLASKRLAFRIDGTVSTFASFSFALPFYLVLLTALFLWKGMPAEFPQAFLLLVLLRSVTDVFAEGMKMHAFNHGDISVVASFFSVSPLFLLILSPLITGDAVSLAETIAVLLVVAGSLALVYRPSHADWHRQRKGILLALGAAVFFALNSCFDRRAVVGGDPYFTPVIAGFAMTLLSAVMILPFALTRPGGVASLRRHWQGLSVRGFLEVAFMVGKLSASQHLSPPKVAGILRLSLVLSIIGGRVFFKEGDFPRRLLAGILIIAGVWIITWMNL
jgi:drug/metabolite transporter (DMT)-like permease